MKCLKNYWCLPRPSFLLFQIKARQERLSEFRERRKRTFRNEKHKITVTLKFNRWTKQRFRHCLRERGSDMEVTQDAKWIAENDARVMERRWIWNEAAELSG